MFELARRNHEQAARNPETYAYFSVWAHMFEQRRKRQRIT